MDLNIEHLSRYLVSRLEETASLSELKKFQTSGLSSAGKTSPEEIFTREFISPAIADYFYKEVRQSLSQTDEEIKRGLGIEGFAKCPSFGFTPARKSPHIFTKHDIICKNPPATWMRTSVEKLPAFQACPDFAIRSPLPICALGEVKLFTRGSISRAVTELYNACRQVVFYLGAFRDEYKMALLVVADASPDRAFRRALDEAIKPELRERLLGPPTGICLTVPVTRH